MQKHHSNSNRDAPLKSQRLLSRSKKKGIMMNELEVNNQVTPQIPVDETPEAKAAREAAEKALKEANARQAKT